MIKDLEKKIKSLKNIKLSDNTKEKMLSEMQMFVHSNSIKKEVDISSSSSGWSFLFMNFFAKEKFIMIGLIILLLITGGVSVNAEKALPGDLLYPVKIHFNEEIQTLFVFGTESKADLAVILAEKRLKEAEDLALKGRLNAKAREKLETNFNKQIKRTENRIKKLEESGKSKAVTKLESVLEFSLDVHNKVILNLKEEEKLKNPDILKEIEVLNFNIKSKIELLIKHKSESKDRKLEDKIKPNLPI